MATFRLDRDEVRDELLPQLCMKCGAVATLERKKSFSWCPSWVLLLLLVGLFPCLIVGLILHPSKITDDTITLVKVSRDFADALKEYRGRYEEENHYRRKPRERSRENAEDNPYRRKPREWSREDDEKFREERN